MKRKSSLLNLSESKKHKSEDIQSGNLYKFFNCRLSNNRLSAIKENISLPNLFDNLNQFEKMNIFKNVISQFHGWSLTDEIEFYNEDHVYFYFDNQIHTE